MTERISKKAYESYPKEGLVLHAGRGADVWTTRDNALVLFYVPSLKTTELDAYYRFSPGPQPAQPFMHVAIVETENGWFSVVSNTQETQAMNFNQLCRDEVLWVIARILMGK